MYLMIDIPKQPDTSICEPIRRTFSLTMRWRAGGVPKFVSVRFHPRASDYTLTNLDTSKGYWPCT